VYNIVVDDETKTNACNTAINLIIIIIISFNNNRSMHLAIVSNVEFVLIEA
jgi:hypothetical protein